MCLKSGAEQQEDKSTPLAYNDASGCVIVLIQYYLPGFKAGGPIRSVANLVDTLGQELKFKVVTSDRDIDDRVPYPGIAINDWMRVGNADVMYLSPGLRGLIRLISLLLSAGRGDVIYLNSFYSRRFSMLPMLLRSMKLIRSRRTVLAPRGEFSEAALRLKNRRKTLFLKLARWFKVYRNVVFHASSKFEASDIARTIERRRSIHIAEVVPSVATEYHGRERRRGTPSIAIAEDIARPKEVASNVRQAKVCGRLNIVFASRICPMKNLMGALAILDGLEGDVAFDIYGPAEDKKYWEACQVAIGQLPSNIQVKYHGVVEHDRLATIFAGSDLFFLPTCGENYGHVICEAMIAGCPVLISDRTPWRNLQQESAGWDIPLEDLPRFREVLKDCVTGDEARQSTLSIGAHTYARQRLSMPEVLDANRKLFCPAAFKTSDATNACVPTVATETEITRRASLNRFERMNNEES